MSPRAIVGNAVVASLLAVAVACGSDDSGANGNNANGNGGNANGQLFGGDNSDGGANADGANGNGNCNAPVDMFIMFDRSHSMGADCNIGDNTSSKWCRAITALSGYFNSDGAQNQAAAIQFFPLEEHEKALCDTGDKYSASDFPTDGYQDLKTNAFDTILNQRTVSPGMGLGTPTEAAIRGMSTFTSGHRRPGRVTIGILITDGDPNGCDENLTNLSNLLKKHFDDTTLRTYVIGMTGADFGNLEQIAAGGGTPDHGDTVGALTNACGGKGSTCKAWNVGDGDPAAFEAALKAIQDSADGCKPGGAQPNPVN